MIEYQNIEHAFGNKPVLHDVNLSFETAKTHVILGSSGCGKTTLIRMLCRLITPKQGKIFLDGAEIQSSNASEIRSKIGYMIQDGGLFPHLSAKENVCLPAKISHWDEGKTQKRLEELCQLVSLEPSQISKYPSELSGGQRQRLGLMRALFLNPPYLLLDEPLSALDPIVRAELQKELKDIFNRLNKTVIIVTHDINEAAFFGSTITLMNEGRVIQHGTFEEFFEKPNTVFVEKFFQAQKPNKIYRNYL